jgi:hypothetical protein
MLVDFSVMHDSKRDFYFEEPDSAEREQYIWSCVDREFSEPISADPALAEYAPTQIISEYFKRKKFDGVVYKSRLGKGLNVALFDRNTAELANCFLIRVNGISYNFDEPSSGYHIKLQNSE